MKKSIEQLLNQMEEIARRGVISVTEATEAIIPGVEMNDRIITIAKTLRECARVWVPHTCLIGNISAGDLLELADAVLEGGAIGEVPAPSKGESQCPPVPVQDILDRRGPWLGLQDAADWGFTQALAAAQRLAAEERQRAADEELYACVHWLEENDMLKVAHHELRAARRPPAPSKREQAIKALRERLGDCSVMPNPVKDIKAMELAIQALEEAGDEC